MASTAATSSHHNDYEADDPWPTADHTSGPRGVGHDTFEPHSHRRPSADQRRSRSEAQGLSFYEMLREDPRQRQPSTFANQRHERNSQRRKPHQRSPTDGAGGLTEAVAPKPISEHPSSSSDESWRKETHLEAAERHQRDRRGQDQSPSSSNPRLTLLYTIANLVFFSILGVLARLGVQWLTFYPGAPVTISNLWANFGGTLFMGFLAEDKSLFHHEDKTKKTIPLFIGLTTGFCGTFTSFSTFMRDVFFALANSAPAPVYHREGASRGMDVNNVTTPRNNGYSVNAVLAIIILTIAVPCAALFLGAHLAMAIGTHMPKLPPRLLRRFIEPLIVFLGFGAWLGALFMSIWPPDRPGGPASRGDWDSEVWRGDAVFACLLVPIGCILRWYASAKLNPLIPSFPLGTFTVNMLGTAVLGMCLDFQRVPLQSAAGMVGGGLVGCQVLQGVEDGFCGGMTTVSVWIVELTTLKRRHAYLYGLLSVLVGIGLTVIIMGSVKWSIGWQPVVCKTSNI